MPEFRTAVADIPEQLRAGSHPFSEYVGERVERVLRQRYTTALFLAGAATIASVAFFTARGSIRTAILVVAGLKLLAYLVRVARRPEFRVAAADYGSALAVLLAAALYVYARWHAAGMGWLIAAVAVSLVAGLVQVRRIAFHRHFNHNDLFHVIQMVALYLFFRGGALLVDR